MTTQQEAYINGFVKRASEYGFTTQEALNLFKESQEAPANLAQPVAQSAAPAKPGFFDKAKQYFKSKVPAYPTSLGTNAGGYDQLAQQFQEQAGG